MGLMEATGPEESWWRNMAWIAVMGPERRDKGPLDRSQVSIIGMSPMSAGSMVATVSMFAPGDR